MYFGPIETLLVEIFENVVPYLAYATKPDYTRMLGAAHLPQDATPRPSTRHQRATLWDLCHDDLTPLERFVQVGAPLVVVCPDTRQMPR